MNINASIIDQQVRALAERQKATIEEKVGFNNNDDKLRSAAFVVLVVKTLLDLTEEEAVECLTEGGGDFGVDAVEVGEVQDGEFGVTLFQGKYKSNLDGESNFPQTGIEKLIQAAGTLFDPYKTITVNSNLKPRIEEIRSFVADGYLPQVRVIACNNGAIWKNEAQELIENAGFGDQVMFEHVNHDSLVAIIKSLKPVNDTLRLTGKAIVEDYDFRRVLVGKIAVSELAALFDRHGDRLLERNIRRYLGLQGNRINEGIAYTLTMPEEQPNFYFYNNGITLTCNQFQHNALQDENWSVKLSGMQIINGGQTCKTIQRKLASGSITAPKASVLVRIYELPKGEEDLVRNITYATNSQNPVDLRDLRSNDDRQQKLALSIKELDYSYRRQRSEVATKNTDITSGTAAEAVLSIWRHRPHQAKFMTGEHFGKLYDTIFTADLNGAQVIIAVLLFRIAENRRKRPEADAPEFIRYSSCFAAMLMGDSLLSEMGIQLNQLDHRTFENARKLIENKGDEYHSAAITKIKEALLALYNDQDVSLQRLAATFRRGDLIEKLHFKPEMLKKIQRWEAPQHDGER
ncbi:MAG: AIPR protein [Candidatus Electronema aureum]|uniref:AIPR protein n=1 Tax=Candidatus Electronema aureum TaxID=2005002 RepID=A0A521G133_9BACT|nr:MAG: AIPR protein [Candidatus Electronema aureum]